MDISFIRDSFCKGSYDKNYLHYNGVLGQGFNTLKYFKQHPLKYNLKLYVRQKIRYFVYVTIFYVMFSVGIFIMWSFFLIFRILNIS